MFFTYILILFQMFLVALKLLLYFYLLIINYIQYNIFFIFFYNIRFSFTFASVEFSLSFILAYY